MAPKQKKKNSDGQPGSYSSYVLKSLNLRRNIYFFETPSSSPLKGTSVICLRIKMATLYLHVNLTPPVLRGW